MLPLVTGVGSQILKRSLNQVHGTEVVPLSGTSSLFCPSPCSELPRSVSRSPSSVFVSSLLASMPCEGMQSIVQTTKTFSHHACQVLGCSLFFRFLFQSADAAFCQCLKWVCLVVYVMYSSSTLRCTFLTCYSQSCLHIFVLGCVFILRHGNSHGQAR